MAKTKVLLVYGGQSSEHDVSLMSARNVFAALDDSRYDVALCLIDRDGHWWLQDTIDDSHIGRPQLLPVLGQKKFITLPDHHIVQPDVIFPVLHGKNGEDGTVQGLFELLGVPYVGPSLLGASVTMDKDVTKRLLRDAGIPVTPWITWRDGDEELVYKDVVSKLGSDVFVKPANSGSSLGVTHVTREDQWQEAINLAKEHDEKILVERSVKGKEMQVSVLGNEQPEVSEVCEIIIGADFHDFEDKYSSQSGAQFFIPARISEEQRHQVRQWALDGYVATGGWGMARADFLVDESGNVVLSEINSIPGFTSVSIYPRLWREAGVPYPKLVSQLIDLALQ